MSFDVKKSKLGSCSIPLLYTVKIYSKATEITLKYADEWLT